MVDAIHTNVEPMDDVACAVSRRKEIWGLTDPAGVMRGVWDLALKYTLTELLLRTINWLETPLGLSSQTTSTATGPVRGFAR